MDPKILLMDEPFAALNPMLQQQLRHELKAARERWGIPAVMITHDVDDVLALADVAYLVDAGRIVREVDLHRATSREVARRTLLPEADAAPLHADEERLRTMLAVFDRA